VVEVNASDARSKSDNKATTGMAGKGCRQLYGTAVWGSIVSWHRQLYEARQQQACICCTRCSGEGQSQGSSVQQSLSSSKTSSVAENPEQQLPLYVV
jgi:hypothetical protein